MTEAVKDVDRGWKMLTKNLSDINKNYPGVVIGIQGELAELVDPEHGDLSNAELGVIHEFGTEDGGIASRSFIGDTVDINEDYLKAEIDKIGTVAFDGETPEGSLLILGEDLKAKILKRVNDGIPPPLDEATLIDRPGEGINPLWATGQMLGSLGTVIVNSNEVDRE